MSHSHSAAPWSSGANEHHHVHSAYAAAGPSSYRAPYSNPSAHHAHFQYQQTEQWPRQAASASSPEQDQSIVRTSHVTADGTTVYAATGRKRKRLQKACVACHKAKRRCDGGLPCSNCDFSGRTCCYSDATGKMVVPTARVANEVSPSSEARLAPSGGPAPAPAPALTTMPQPMHAFQPTNTHEQQSRMRSSTFSSQSTSPKMGGMPSQSGPLLTIDDVAPERRREMISIFFSQLHPFSCVVDEITFLRDLSTSEVPSWLLMSMFALSARFQQGGSELERERRFLNGERFARTARSALHTEDQDGFTLLDRPDVDLVLALCFLAAHEFGMGRLHRALSYSNNAVRTVAALKLAEGITPPTRNSHYGRDSYSSTTRRSTSERLVLLSWTLDMTISALALQPSAVRREDVSRAVATFGTTRDEARDEVTRSFVRLTEIASVFTRVLDINRSARRDFAPCQQALQAWAESLGVEHKFDDYNMKQASRLLEEPEATAASHRAWFWAQMHLMAECSVFLMEANKALPGQTGHSQPAYDNIQLILSILGIAGRRNLFAIPALLISTEFNRPTPDVLRWWNTARQCWMMGDRQVADAARLFVRPSSSNSAVSPGSDSLVLPRLSSSSIMSAGSSRGSHGSMSLPSLTHQSLPSLRLSHASKSPKRHSADEQDGKSDRSRGSATSADAATERRNVPGVDSSASSPSSSSRAGDNDEDDSSSSVLSPKSMPQDLYHSHPSPLYRNPTRSSVSPTLPSQPSFHKDPRDTWSPISSLRTDKRSLPAPISH